LRCRFGETPDEVRVKQRTLDSKTTAGLTTIAFLVVLVIRPSVDPFGLGVPVGGLLLLLAAFLVYLVPHNGPIPMIDKTAFAVVVTLFVSMLGSKFLIPSFIAATKISTGFVVFIAAGCALRLGVKPIVLLRVVLISAFIPSVIALIQVATGGGQELEVELFSDEKLNRVFGTFVNANSLALFCAVLLFCCAAMLTQARRMERLAVGALLSSCMVLVLFTYTRSVQIGVAVGLLVLLFRVRRGLGILALVGLMVVPVMVPSVAARFSELGAEAPDDPSFEGSANSFVWRLEYWQQIAVDIPDAPLTGQGIGSTELSQRQGLQPHNTYLQMLLETGTLGAIAMIAFVGSCFSAINRTRGRFRIVGLAGSSALIAYLVAALTENTLAPVSVAPLLILVRVGIEAGQRSDETKTEPSDVVGSDVVANDVVANETVGSDVVGSDVVGSDVVGSDVVGSEAVANKGKDADSVDSDSVDADSRETQLGEPELADGASDSEESGRDSDSVAAIVS
jgi:O-antigen ligase